MGKLRIKIWGGKDTIRIKNKNNEEIGLATDREDYHEEIVKIIWNLNKKGYIENWKIGTLHRYMMEKWYGDNEVKDFLQKDFVIDHINNMHNDNRISNLAFYARSRNSAKGMYLDKESKEIKDQLRVAIHKDFSNECYQISIAFNECFVTLKEDDRIVQVFALFLFYSSDISYDAVVNDATNIITMFQDKGEIDLTYLRYCNYKLYDEDSDSLFGMELINDESEDGERLIIPLEDCIFEEIPQEEIGELTEEVNRLYCERIILAE